MNYTRVTDNVAVRPAPTGSTHAPGWYGPDTTVDYEDMNGLMGEIAAAIVALGGSLDTDVYDQLATALTEYVLTNGRFSTSLKVGPEKAGSVAFSVDFFDVGGGDYIINLRLFGQTIATMDTRLGGFRRHLYATYCELGRVVADDGIEVEGDITAKDKIKNADGADVVFDDGIEVEGTLTVGSTTEYTVKALSGTVDADDFAGGAEFGQSSSIVNYTDHPVYEITLTISNSNATARDIMQGDTILLNLASGSTGQLVKAHAYTTAGSTNAQKGARWSVSECLDVSDSDTRKIAITQVGKTTVSIGGSGSGETMTVKVLLTYSTLTAI